MVACEQALFRSATRGLGRGRGRGRGRGQGSGRPNPVAACFARRLRYPLAADLKRAKESLGWDKNLKLGGWKPGLCLRVHCCFPGRETLLQIVSLHPDVQMSKCDIVLGVTLQWSSILQISKTIRRNISQTSASVSPGVPNTEKSLKSTTRKAECFYCFEVFQASEFSTTG